MFKINPAPTFRARVPLSVPGADSAVTVEFEFKHKGRTALAVWWKSVDGRKDAEILAEIIASWKGPIDDKGEPVQFSVEALSQVLDNYPASAAEILTAYEKELWKSREKN